MYDPTRNGINLLNSVERTCARLDLGKTTLYELLKKGRLEAVKVGTKTLITEASIQTFLSDLLATAPHQTAREVA